jgi:hypothetical protein
MSNGKAGANAFRFLFLEAGHDRRLFAMKIQQADHFRHDQSKNQGKGHGEHQQLGVFPLFPVLLAGKQLPA